MNQSNAYSKYSPEQIDKIGNAIVYLAQKISDLSKTKLLKLIYLLDELSIREYGLPFFNLKYKVWKFGPVAEDIFVEFSSEQTLLNKYAKREVLSPEITYIRAIADFNDDEFSDNDIHLLNYVIEKFGTKTATELIAYTHRPKSPWHNEASSNNLLEMFNKGEIGNTDYLIDMSQLVAYDNAKKEIYEDYLLAH